MKRTNKYQLPYYLTGDDTTSDVEIQRWQSIDVQLYALFNIIGNGILEGWDLEIGEGLSVTITLGQGNVAFVACKTDSNSTISNLTPSTRNYIYAQLRIDSYWTQNVDFGAFISTTTSDGLLYLGYVDTDATVVTAVNMDNRSLLGFRDLIQQIVAEHRHIGGTLNPTPIDLSSEVQGVLNQNSIPDLDASIIQTGVIDSQRLPKIDHETKVTDVGTLTHNQLDSFASMLSFEDKKLMGEVSTINLLQLTLALKHAYPNIDDYLVNQVAYIPGISPDDYVDWINTTATVDVRTYAEGGTHTISGEPVAGLTLYSHVWDTEEGFASDTYQDVIIDGDSVILDTTTQTLLLDDFSDLSEWAITTSDLSSVVATPQADSSTFIIPPQSAKISVGSQSVEVSLNLIKTFTAQDWSDYKYLIFYIKTTSVQHGDIYFNFSDSKYGTQNSYKLVLPRNTPTIDLDTLQNGWQEITIDISGYERSSIDTMSFTLSTQNGWDTSVAFDFNIDDIYLQAGSVYLNDGYVRVIFGSDFFYRFWKIRWDAIIPTDSESSGLLLKSRARVANTTGGLPLAPWTDYTEISGEELPFPTTTLYKYIEIEMYLGASTSLKRSPCIKKIYLDFYANASDNSFVFDTQGDWETGSRFNIDTETIPGSIQVSNIEDVGTYYYGTNGKIGHTDANLDEIYSIVGTSLPKTTYQVLNDVAPSLGLITGIVRGNNGNVWVSDIDNDRVIEMDMYGNLVRGFYGSFLTAPQDVYGTEEAGPGSNTDVSTSTTTATIATTLNVLHTIYNSLTGILYIVFDSDLTNIYAPNPKIDMTKIYIKVGSQRVYLNDSTIGLLGIDEDKYNAWINIKETQYLSFINQFITKSHVLTITLEGAEKTFLDYMVNQMLPTITIVSPNEQKMINTGSLNVKFALSNFSLDNGESIRVKIDSGAWQTIYVDNISYSGLANGKHVVNVQLVDILSVPLTNIGAEASVSFVVESAYSLPYLSIVSPKQNQVSSSSPVMVEFTCVNFPIVPSAQHVQYSIDSGTPVDHYSLSPIQLDDIEPGEHTISIYTVDSKGTKLVYTYGEVISTFIVGLNPYAPVKLYVDFGAIYDTTDLIPASTSRTYIDIANVTFSNIYAPIDIQVMPYDLGGLGDGLPTILVAKMRSPSWNSSMGSSLMALELVNRIAKALIPTTGTQTIALNPDFASIMSNLDLIYLTKYLDGHSVVELNIDGEVVLSNNIAIFSDTKENAKSTLGSAEKIGVSEILIGDSIRKRALIAFVDLTTQLPAIEWEYTSDRYIVDFHAVPQEQKTILITDDAISEPISFIRQGTSVTWINNSSVPISIYSGTTTLDLFTADPDLNLYGDVFHSEVLDVGETYTFSFTDIGTYNWFTYPDILTATVNVSEQRLSSTDNFYVLESDGKSSPYTSRLSKIDKFGNCIWNFGEGYLILPRDCRPMSNGNVLIST